MLTCVKEAVLHGAQLRGDGDGGRARVDADEALPAGSFQEAGAGGLRSFPLGFRLLAQVQAGIPGLSQDYVQGAAGDHLQSCNNQNNCWFRPWVFSRAHAELQKAIKHFLFRPWASSAPKMGCGTEPVSHT